MKGLISAGILAIAFAFPIAAQAEADGSQQAAGGAHMSSYVNDPQHDPRSLHAQRNSTGQIQGAPMLSERAGAHAVRTAPGDTRWTAGTNRRHAR